MRIEDPAATLAAVRALLGVLSGLPLLACGPSATFVLAPEGIDWVAGFGTGVDGGRLSTPLVSTAGGAELSFEPRPFELTLVGLAEADLAPYQHQRARWSSDRVLPVAGCEVRLPPARWAATLSGEAQETVALPDAPRFTTAWLDEARNCDGLEIEAEVRCGGLPALCLPNEGRLGGCRFELPMCAQVGGQRLTVELESAERSCSLDAQSCQASTVEGKLVFACPPHSGVACSATVHVRDLAAATLEVSQALSLPGDAAYTPRLASAERQEDELLALDEAGLGIGQDLVVVDDLLVVLGRPDGRGGILANTQVDCPTPDPRAFFFFDAADGRRRPELDRPAPPCTAWLEAADVGFFGVRREGEADFVVSHFDALGAETSSVAVSTASLRDGGRVRLLLPAPGPAPHQLLVAVRRGELDPEHLARSWLMLFERPAGGGLRLRWQQDYAGIDDDTELQSVGVLDPGRVVSVDGAADQFMWFGAADGSFLGGARVQPFEARGMRLGPTLHDGERGALYVPVGRGRSGLVILDAELTQKGVAEYTRSIPVTVLGPALESATRAVVFLYDVAAGRAKATTLRGESNAYLDPRHLDLGEGGPVRRVQRFRSALWCLRPWSGKLVQVAPLAGSGGP